MNKSDGGPAFPGPYVNEDKSLEVLWKQQGMTLRQYYAAEAMKPLMQHFLTKGLHFDNPDWMEGLAGDAFRMADAMLKEESDEP